MLYYTLLESPSHYNDGDFKGYINTGKYWKVNISEIFMILLIYITIFILNILKKYVCFKSSFKNIFRNEKNYFFLFIIDIIIVSAFWI